MERHEALTAVQTQNLSAPQLAEIARVFSEDTEILRGVMRHPNTPSEVLQNVDYLIEIGISGLVDWLENPALPLILIGDMQFLAMMPQRILFEILKKAHRPAWFIAFLQQHTNPSIAESVQWHIQIHKDLGMEWVEKYKKYLLEETTNRCEKPDGERPTIKRVRKNSPKPPINLQYSKLSLLEYDRQTHFYCSFQNLRNCKLPEWCSEWIQSKSHDEYIVTESNDAPYTHNFSDYCSGNNLIRDIALFWFLESTCPYTAPPTSNPHSTGFALNWQRRLHAVFHPEITQETLEKMQEDGNVFVRAAVRDRLAGVDIVGLFWDK
jgi:hypothetical protein